MNLPCSCSRLVLSTQARQGEKHSQQLSHLMICIYRQHQNVLLRGLYYIAQGRGCRGWCIEEMLPF